MTQQETFVGMRQAVVRDQRRDVRDLGLLGAQEFLARGDVVEQVAHGDDGAAGERGFFAAQNLAARDFDRRADGFLARLGLEQQPRYRCDRRQRFAAESERGDRQQIFHVGKFAGGVALEGQQRVVAHHAHAVVGEADQAAAAGFDIQAEFGRAGVERVFEQFLDDAGRALDHFSGGDFIGDVVGENADAAHAEGSLPLGRSEDGVDGKASAEEQRNFLPGAIGDRATVWRGDFHQVQGWVDDPELLTAVFKTQLFLVQHFGGGVRRREHFDDDLGCPSEETSKLSACPSFVPRVCHVRYTELVLGQCSECNFSVRTARATSGLVQQVTQDLLDYEMIKFWRGHLEQFPMAQLLPKTLRRVRQLLELREGHELGCGGGHGKSCLDYSPGRDRSF